MFVSCLMPTMARRRWCIPNAIRYWKRQHYRFSELVIMTDGDDSERIDDLIPDDPNITYIHHPEPLALSDKYNKLVEASLCDWIALWADDDWQAPWRLTYTVTKLAAEGPTKEIAGLRTMIFHRLGTDKTWLYRRPGLDPYFLGGSILFHRNYWLRHPFPDGKRSRADADFTNAIDPDEYARVAVVLDDPTFYVAMNHDDNVGRSKTDPLRDNENDLIGWSWYEGDVGVILGEDADLYRP